MRRSLRRWIVRALTLLALAPAGWAGYRVATWPDVAALARENPATTAFLERWNAAEKAAGRRGDARLRFVAYRAISAELKHAVVVAEDIDFFSHRGFAVEEIRAAAKQAWEERELPRGASTLTQQLAKNLWLSPSRNPLRKVEEALLTRQLERHLDKRRILETYLNVVEFGPGVWGCENAARRYFGKSAAALDAGEAAQLAAGLSRPSSWHPGVSSRGYQRQIERIAGRMRRSAWVRAEL